MKTKETVGVAAFAIGSLAIIGSAVASPALQEPQHSLEVADLAPAISQSATDEASVPDWLADSDSGIDPETVRNVGTSELGEHWIASDDDGNICIATQLGDESTDHWVGASSCTSPIAFYKHGVYQTVGGDGFDGTAAFMLPPDVDSSALIASGDFEILEETPQVIAVTRTDQLSKLQDIDIHRAGGLPFQLGGLDWK